MLTQLTSIKGRKLEIPLESKKQNADQFGSYLLKSITVHSQKTGTYCMILATPTWSWGGSILRKVMLDRQSSKRFYHCFRSNPRTASSMKPAMADTLRCSLVPQISLFLVKHL